MLLNRYSAVLFDMDGLLLDTEAIALQVLAATVRRFGFVWSNEVGQRMIGRNGPDGDRVLSDHYGADFDVNAVRAEFLRQYEIHLQTDGVPVKAGVFELLLELQRREIPRAVVTSSRRRLTDLKLHGAGLLDFFGIQVCGDEVSKGKPEPEGYLLAASKLNVAAQGCLVLEDSAPGIRAALAAGMTAWWIPDQPSPDRVDHSVPRFVDLHDVRRRLLSE